MLSSSTVFLRRVLWLDALVSGVAGLLMLFGANPLAGELGLPVSLLRYAGLVMLPYAIGLVYLVRREHFSPRVIWAVIGGNLLWAIHSIALLFTGWVAPTGLGFAFILFQAAVVAGLAELEYVGLRRVAVSG